MGIQVEMADITEGGKPGTPPKPLVLQDPKPPFRTYGSSLSRHLSITFQYQRVNDRPQQFIFHSVLRITTYIDTFSRTSQNTSTLRDQKFIGMVIHWPFCKITPSTLNHTHLEPHIPQIMHISIQTCLKPHGS